MEIFSQKLELEERSVEMAILTVDVVDPHPDRERLVNNNSELSFQSNYADDNQITITRQISDRKYSTMCFKPMDKNMVDITITNKEYCHNKHDFVFGYVTSQDLRQRYIGKAKLGVGVVFTLIFIMLVILVYCLLSPAQMNNNVESGTISVVNISNTIRNTTAYPELYNVTVTDSINGTISQSPSTKFVDMN